MEHENTNKSTLLIIGISFCMGFMSFAIAFGSHNRITIVQTWVQASEATAIIKTGESITWQQVLTIDRDGSGNHWKQEVSTWPIQSLLKIVGHKWFWTWDIRQEYIKYAFEVWGYNLVALMECENWTWGLTRRWDHWLAYGLWQVQLYRFKQIDRERFLTDWKYQIEQVRELRKNWVPFYGPTRIIKGKKCYEYVENRFLYK